MQIKHSDVTYAWQTLAAGAQKVARRVASAAAYAAAEGLQALSNKAFGSASTPRNAVLPKPPELHVPATPATPAEPEPDLPAWLTSPLPLYQQLSWIGTAPGDGNCFFHSAAEIAGREIADRLGLRDEAEVTPRLLRRHMADHLIGQYLQYNAIEKNPAQRNRLLRDQPHLVGLTLPETESKLDLHRADHQAKFVDAVGLENLDRCGFLTPDQKRHVYNIAEDRSWHFESCDLMPQLLASSLPGLRLAVVTPTDRELHVIGHGVDPVHIMFLDGLHYVPARA